MRPATPFTPPPLIESLGLLERAVGYARIALTEVTPDLLDRPTPCSRWDLAALLDHMVESLEALTEAADLRYVDLSPPLRVAGDVPAVDLLVTRACGLLSSWMHLAHDTDVMVGDRPLSSSVLASAGALEIAVHAWDVAQATGSRRPVPAVLALDLLPWLPVLVTAADRPQPFGPALDVPMGGPSARLLALVGRRTQ